jgi:hypothetical protein
MTLVVLVRRLEADCTIIYNPAAYGYVNPLVVRSLIFRRTPLSYEHVPQQHYPANDEDISGREHVIVSPSPVGGELGHRSSTPHSRVA